MELKDWCVKWHTGEEWLGCEAGYYWGEIDRQRMTDEESGEVLLGDTTGPFPTAADAALDMVRTWAMASAAQPRSN